MSLPVRDTRRSAEAFSGFLRSLTILQDYANERRAFQ